VILGWFHSGAVENSVLLGYDAAVPDVSKEPCLRKDVKRLRSGVASYRKITKTSAIVTALFCNDNDNLTGVLRFL
jgi:hypothetical protein